MPSKKKIKKIKKAPPAKKSPSVKQKPKKVAKGKSRPVPKRSTSGKRSTAPVVNEEAIMKLIEKGRHRGFITEAEILHTFPNIEQDIDGLERLYERLESSNLNVIDTGRVFAEEREKEQEIEKERRLEVEQ